MPYDPAVIRAIKRIGRRRNEPGKYILGALATGIVESNLQDLPGGDADSYGFRQQRESIYGRQPLRRQIRNLYDEMHQLDRGQSLGELLADVQRPAAQYRDRYGKVLDDARALLGGGTGGVGTAGPGNEPVLPDGSGGVVGSNPFSVISSLAPNQDPTIQRGWDLLGQIWEQKYGSSGNSPRTSGGVPPLDGGMSNPGLQSIISQANKIDAARVPYLWGGGHDARQDPGSEVSPLDCSGAVSRVLGIDPRVSGEFENWGESGRGKHVTIYANDEHVLMEINGHFWGTSASNPGGGAGWIPRDQISPEYLKRFKARHPKGL